MASTTASDLDDSPRGEDTGLWAKARRKLKPPRLLSMTRAGKFFVLITLGVGFGAINTGNNLLFLLFGMMLSLIIASGLLSEAVLRNLVLRRRLPRRIEAGRPAPGHIRFINRGWWPALSVEASEQNPRAIKGPLSGQRLGPRPIPWWKFWRRQTGRDRRPQAAVYTLRVDAEDELDAPTHYEFPTRGRYHLAGLQLTTRFPFGLFEKTRQFAAPDDVTVLPDALPADEWTGQLHSRHGDTAKNQRGRGRDFYGLRDYRPGDDRRSIHWKTTARRGEPMVKQTEARRRRSVLVVFDNRAPADDPTDDHIEQFERGIRHLAGLIQTLRRRNYRVGLVTTEKTIRPDSPKDPPPLVRHLAVIELHPHNRPPPGIDDQDLHDERYLFVGFESVVSSRGSDPVTMTLEQLPASAEASR